MIVYMHKNEGSALNKILYVVHKYLLLSCIWKVCLITKYIQIIVQVYFPNLDCLCILPSTVLQNMQLLATHASTRYIIS